MDNTVLACMKHEMPKKNMV